MKKLLFLALLALALTSQAVRAQMALPIPYGNQNATGANDGTSWEKAYANLQTALDAANQAGGAALRIAAGTYYPTNGPGHTAPGMIPVLFGVENFAHMKVINSWVYLDAVNYVAAQQGGSIRVQNSIFWAPNRTTNPLLQVVDDSISYSIVATRANPSMHVMDADPLVGEGTVDPLSPVINAGSLVGLGNLITEDEPGVDYANNPRIQQDTIDIGIFESPYSTPVGFADARIASFLNVYPNPATTTVYVALPGVAIRSLAVLDVQGRTVDATLGRGATSLGFATVDVSRLPPGL